MGWKGGGPTLSATSLETVCSRPQAGSHLPLSAVRLGTNIQTGQGYIAVLTTSFFLLLILPSKFCEQQGTRSTLGRIFGPEGVPRSDNTSFGYWSLNPEVLSAL